ncbi:MAG: adenosylcobalamin-dependent ribonucleoside-diphosphate reductase [Planctomycetes bacterium]|nr:adenosylcobalamin-dependent ribonucleoside-diphosphate reductase [Planctomycetota bacterium]
MKSKTREPSPRPAFNANALQILERRYLQRDESGVVIETPEQLLERVAHSVASGDEVYEGAAVARASEARFLRMMSELRFLPNSPTLMNAGTSLGQLAACFVLPVPDSIEGIFDTLKRMALIHQSGGGTGFSFSRVRPKNDVVRSTGGIASGPVSFMRVFDETTDVIKQGGRRRGANIGVLRVDHPDIVEFIECKLHEGAFHNFNLSVGVTDAFMDAAQNDGSFALVSPRSGKTVQTVRARDLFDRIADTAWRTGDPGVIFLDEVNRWNPTPDEGPIEATNPCGEQPLLPFEACTLGSINLAAFARDGRFDWDAFAETIRDAVRFLDDVVEVNHYPAPEVEAISRRNRKIGLGVMGFAEALVRLGLPYDAPEALEHGRRTMQFLKRVSHEASAALAATRGPFPNFAKSRLASGPPMRNAAVTTVAPTGTIAILAGVSSGIEPLFALSYVRHALDDVELLELNPEFLALARARGFDGNRALEEVAKRGTLRGLASVPDDLRRLFVTAFDLAPDVHVRMQAAFQESSDSAVSKTVNLPETATVDDVREIYRLAHRLHLKGVTVFRYGCRGKQVLYRTGNDSRAGTCEVGAEFSGECRICD